MDTEINLKQKYESMLQDKTLEQRIKEHEEKEEREKIDKLKSKIISIFGERYLKKGFGCFEIYEPKQAEVVEFCKKYKESGSKESVILSGEPGTGKTHLIAAIFRTFPGSLELVQFSTMSNIKVAAQAERKNWEIAIKPYIACDMLIIDDFGIRQLTDSQKELFYFVINERYNKNKPVFITTNLSSTKIKTAIDFDVPRSFRRLFEMTNNFKNFIDCDWKPYYLHHRDES